MTLPTKFNVASLLPGEEQFLDAIVANLADDLPKLIYADWLTERGDERADFLRAYVAAVRSGGDLPKPASNRDSWEEIIGYHLDKRIRAIGVVDQRETIMRMAKPAIAIQLEGCDEDDIPAGGTKFGGLPHLPADMDWPRCEGGAKAAHSRSTLNSILPTWHEL